MSNISISSSGNENSSPKSEIRQRCFLCSKDKNQTKYKDIGVWCEIVVCPRHSFTIAQIPLKFWDEIYSEKFQRKKSFELK